ncbi:hypothetical protein JCM33774_33420 [Actinophytocola sp. KF-1]
MRSSRLGLLLALLLVLVAGTAPAAPTAAAVGAAPGSAHGGTVSAASSSYDEQHDRPRGSVTTGHAPTTPDTWWVVWPPADPGHTPQPRSSVAGIDSCGTPAAVVIPRSSRAPPRA